MTILNRNRCLYLYTDRQDNSTSSPNAKLEHRENTAAWCILNYEDIPVVYHEFRLGNAFEVFPLVNLMFPPYIMRLKQKSLFLVINNSHEAFHSVVDDIYQNLIIKQQIPASQIILVSESADIYNEVKKVAAKYNLPEIKAEWILQFEWNISIAKQNMLRDGHTVETLEDKVYTKKFVNLNRRWRPHRVALVATLKALGVLDQGHVSLAKSDDDNSWERTWWYVKHLCSGHTELENLLNAHEQEIMSLPPLYLDTQDLVTNKAELTNSTDYLYQETYFSVISETNFYTGENHESGRFLSEKTFKPIAMKHPFLMYSVPGMLEKLKEIGYKTFSPMIDESYDNELDDKERLYKIAKETQRLCNLSPTELTEYLEFCRPIVKHNFDLLINKNKFSHRLNW